MYFEVWYPLYAYLRRAWAALGVLVTEHTLRMMCYPTAVCTFNAGVLFGTLDLWIPLYLPTKHKIYMK